MPSSRGCRSSYDCIVKIEGVTTRPILFSQLMRSDGEGAMNPEELFADVRSPASEQERAREDELHSLMRSTGLGEILPERAQPGHLPRHLLRGRDRQTAQRGEVRHRLRDLQALKETMDCSKRFVLIVGNHTATVAKGSCSFCNSYNSWTRSCARPHSIDCRSYIGYECDEVVKADIEIVVLYNAARIDKAKCPEAVKWKGTHVPWSSAGTASTIGTTKPSRMRLGKAFLGIETANTAPNGTRCRSGRHINVSG